MKLPELIALGEALYLLRNAQITTAETVANTINQVKNLVDALGLERTKTASKTLISVESIPTIAGRVTEVARLELKAMTETIANTVYSELREYSVVPANHVAIAEEFLRISNEIPLNETQQNLLNEAVAAFQVGAYRACMVMTWNSIYDFIRQWVFDHRLPDFNTALASGYVDKNQKPVFDAVNDYSDFHTGQPSERVVIDTCFRARIFGERVRDELRHNLRRRNDSAHATARVPDATQASAYARDMLDIAKSRPFSTVASTSP